MLNLIECTLEGILKLHRNGMGVFPISKKSVFLATHED